MQKCGVDSEILIRTKVHDDTQAMEIFKNPIQKFGSKAKNVVNLTLSKKDIISDYLGTDVSAHPMVRDADVLVLHWVNSFLSYRSVEKLLATGKTVIWVMHDMWTFTGEFAIMTGTAADMLMTAETVPIWKAGKKTICPAGTLCVRHGP